MYSRRQLAEKAKLNESDLAEVHRCRQDHNRLGFAYQLGFVRLLSRFPKQDPLELIDELLTFTSVQLSLAVDLIGLYLKRQQTISDHQQRIVLHLRLTPFDARARALLERFVFEQSWQLAQTAALQARAKAFLKEQGILQPADYRIARIVGEQRKLAREAIFDRIAASITPELKRTLDELLVVKPGDNVSELQQVKANLGKPSVAAIQAGIKKLHTIEATGVTAVDLSWLNSNYQRALYHHVRKSSAHRLRELTPPRSTASLVCFLWQSYRDAIDQTVDVFDKLMTRTFRRAQNELDEQLRRQRKTIRTQLATLKKLGEVILDEDVPDANLRAAVFERVSRSQLADCVQGVAEWVTGKKSDVLHGVVRRYGNLRKFTPALLEALELLQDVEGDESSCLQAVRVLKEANAGGKRKLPATATTSFVSQRLRPVVGEGEQLNRHAWECVLLLKLRDEIRAGNISVKHSKRFGQLTDFFIPQERWTEMRAGFFEHAKLPTDPGEVPAYFQQRLGKAYDQFLSTSPTNSYAVVDDKGWHLSTDPADKLDDESQAKLAHLKGWLAKNMRQMRLPDLLIEVDNDLGFTRHFMAPKKRQDPLPEEVCTILAAVLAHGCNIGTYTMAQLTSDVTYEQLKRVSDWHITAEAQRAALAVLVKAIADLDTSLHWGEGKTSASDGQRFALPRKVLQQTYSTKFSDFALEFYTFVADNYAPFYSTPIECTDRDAAFVLDGLLYNESELELEEHYTDTHGYTEINFAAFAMLGRRFCPRIRGLHHQHIYRIDPDRDYGALATLVGRADRTIDTRAIAEQWDRMGQLYASLEAGHATASVVLKRLAGFSAKNRFYRANMSEPGLRTRIRRGLLKVEQLHALARDVFYGRRGRVNARELWEQMNTCSCLTLIVACIVYWQAKEISRAIRRGDPEIDGVDLAFLQHVSPIEWSNITLYGQYVLNRKLIRRQPNPA
jgi:TnpA family transposase